MHAPPSISTYWCLYVLLASATEIGRRSALRYSPHVGIVPAHVSPSVSRVQSGRDVSSNVAQPRSYLLVGSAAPLSPRRACGEWRIE